MNETVESRVKKLSDLKVDDVLVQMKGNVMDIGIKRTITDINYKCVGFGYLSIALENAVHSYNFINDGSKIPIVNDVETYFTSDTHFGSQRTLELSRRPFKNVNDMDDTITENWNKTISNTDIIYHLGDFGEYETALKLNGRIVLLMGNYEFKYCEDNGLKVDEFKMKMINEYGFEDVITDRFAIVHSQRNNYGICHEPSNKKGDIFYLFGHIHKLQMVRRNSLNVGVDCHDFTPIGADAVEFYKNAIENFYDGEVFEGDKI